MKVFLNPGHAPNGNPDSGACGNGLRECDIAKDVADLVESQFETLFATADIPEPTLEERVAALEDAVMEAKTNG